MPRAEPLPRVGDAFLKRLDGAEQDALPPTVTAVADPLTVSAGQSLDAEWTVERVLGTGAGVHYIARAHRTVNALRGRRTPRALRQKRTFGQLSPLSGHRSNEDRRTAAG
jgi:hypothetical protein